MKESNPQGWEFNIHLYNAIYFGEFIEARRYAVQLFREYIESNQHLIKFQPSQSESNMYDVNKCLKYKHQLGKPHQRDYSTQIGSDANGEQE